MHPQTESTIAELEICYTFKKNHFTRWCEKEKKGGENNLFSRCRSYSFHRGRAPRCDAKCNLLVYTLNKLTQREQGWRFVFVCFQSQSRGPPRSRHTTRQQRLLCGGEHHERATSKGAMQQRRRRGRDGFSIRPMAALHPSAAAAAGTNEQESAEIQSAKMIETDRRSAAISPRVQKEKKKGKSMMISIDSSEGVGVITVHYNDPQCNESSDQYLAPSSWCLPRCWPTKPR